MTRIDGLKCMLELAEKGEWHFNLSAQVFPPESAFGRCTFMDADEAFYGSLDAAKALHEAVLPRWTNCDHLRRGLRYTSYLSKSVEDETVHAVSSDPARAWLIAILKALISIEESKE